MSEKTEMELDETKMYISPSKEQLSIFIDGKWSIFIRQDVVSKPDHPSPALQDAVKDAIDKQKEDTRQWLIDEGFEILAERL